MEMQKIEELESREKHEREISGIKMYGVSTGRDTGERSWKRRKKARIRN